MSMSEPPWIVIALGANLADAPAQVRHAARTLRGWSPAGSDFRASSIWSSTPEDCPPGSPRFANAVVAFPSCGNWTPDRLLHALQALERTSGRTPKRIHNEARVLDLDLIAFGSEQRHTPRLTLPHPRAHLRRFVLEPLSEILPELVVPGWPGTPRDCLARALPDPLFLRIGPLLSETG